MKTILRSELDNENELTAKQTREFYVRSQVTALTDVEYIKDTSLDFCKKQNLKSAMVKSIGLPLVGDAGPVTAQLGAVLSTSKAVVSIFDPGFPAVSEPEMAIVASPSESDA